jgi:hypothetical protein
VIVPDRLLQLADLSAVELGRLLASVHATIERRGTRG